MTTGRKKRYNHRKESTLAAVLFLAPAVIMLCIWFVYPLIQAFLISFQDFNYMFKDRAAFIGLANYKNLFHDSEFYQALTHSLLFVAVTVPVQTCVALLLAVALNTRCRGFRILHALCAFLRGRGHCVYVFLCEGRGDVFLSVTVWTAQCDMVRQCGAGYAVYRDSLSVADGWILHDLLPVGSSEYLSPALRSGAD